MKLKQRKKSNLRVLFLIIILTCSMLYIIGDKLLYHIENITMNYVDKAIYKCVFFGLNEETLGSKELLNVINLNKNKDGEVISVDYNMDIAYEVLNKEMELLYLNINAIRLEEYKMDSNGLYYLPVGLVNDSFVLHNFGFKIPCVINFIHDMDIGFKTKVKNYGVNNLLVELYVSIDIKSIIMVPNSYKVFSNSYEVLVASKVVMGRVPMYMGDVIEQSSAIVSS